MNTIKQFAISNKNCLNVVLLVISCTCPLLYFLSCGGIFIPTTPLWRLLFKTFFVACHYAAGPIGLITSLSLVMIHKKQLRRNLVLLLGSLLLCFLSMDVILPIAHLFCTCLGCGPIYGLLAGVFLYFLPKCLFGIVLI